MSVVYYHEGTCTGPDLSRGLSVESFETIVYTSCIKSLQTCAALIFRLPDTFFMFSLYVLSIF